MSSKWFWSDLKRSMAIFGIEMRPAELHYAMKALRDTHGSWFNPTHFSRGARYCSVCCYFYCNVASHLCEKRNQCCLMSVMLRFISKYAHSQSIHCSFMQETRPQRGSWMERRNECARFRPAGAPEPRPIHDQVHRRGQAVPGNILLVRQRWKCSSFGVGIERRTY